MLLYIDEVAIILHFSYYTSNNLCNFQNIFKKISTHFLKSHAGTSSEESEWD